MRHNVMYYPSIVLMVVEALALGFLTWEWIKAKRRDEDACNFIQGQDDCKRI